MDIKEILQQEVLRRQKSRGNQMRTMEGLLKDNESLVNIDPELRSDITPLVQFVDDQTGSRLARTVQRPENVREALRKAMNARIQAPKEDPLQPLAQLANMQAREDANDIALLKASSAQGKLSGEQLKRLDNVRMAAGALGDLEGALNKGVSARPDMLAGVIGDNEFSEAATRFAEAIGRMQSGGAITKDEESRFLRLIPKYNDSDEIRKQKIQSMKEILQGRYRNLSQGPDLSTPLFGQGQAQAQPNDGSVDFSKLTTEQLKAIIGGM